MKSIEYTITVDNTGNVDLTGVVLDGHVCRRRTLVSGDINNNSILETTETWIYSADYVVTQADLNAGTALVNVASVDTAQTAPQQDDATSTVAQSPALTIVKSLTNADDAVVDTAGEVIEYTITVDNTGNVDLTGVVLDDGLPAARRWSAATPTPTASSRPPRPGSTARTTRSRRPT